jgi:hypothetical protein
MSMKLGHYQDKVMHDRLVERTSKLSKEKIHELISYTTEEMLAQVELDLPITVEQRQNMENERLMLKQLLANIERNRVKWRKEIFDAESLSI